MRNVFSSLRRDVGAGAFINREPIASGRLMVAVAAAVTILCSSPVRSDSLIEAGEFSELAGFRYGISVTDLDGDVLVAHRADERFAPASNVKLFVTAAALDMESALSAIDSGLRVVTTSTGSGPPALALVGRGDPTIGFGPDCSRRCLETLADAVAASGIRTVGDIIGDDRWFADERKPLGWSWDDLKFGHGTAVSAIAVNKNILSLRVSPSAETGGDVLTSWDDAGRGYFELRNEATTGAEDQSRALRLERRIAERTARLYGVSPSGSRSLKLDLGVDDPAHLAAWYFKNALQTRGVSVSGTLQTRHRSLRYADEPSPTDPEEPASELACKPRGSVSENGPVVASLAAAPLNEIVDEINRESQNLYAEVLLRQLGAVSGRGSSFCGLLQIQKFLDGVGAPRESYDFVDGSGLSNYNRVTPATITALLRHAATAPWGDAFRASLPVGAGADGTLKYRFRGTALEGKIFAKTGSLNHADALSGYMQADSGKTLVFSIIVNDRPLESPSAISEIDAALLKIAKRF
ncbi:MAG: D-alanyl-D-alanine carboxypeptidase/D-alanyl-D-alanine-endopeptidase [Pseudomonadota bacterium]